MISFNNSHVELETDAEPASQYLPGLCVMAASVNDAECVGCGLCVGVCPEEAVAFVNPPVVSIDQAKCTCCGICVQECPNEAISLPELEDAFFGESDMAIFAEPND